MSNGFEMHFRWENWIPHTNIMQKSGITHAIDNPYSKIGISQYTDMLIMLIIKVAQGCHNGNQANFSS